MKDISMLLLVAILGTGLVVCAAGAVTVSRRPAHPRRATDCPHTAEVQALGAAGGGVVLTSRPSRCRSLMPQVSRNV
jgi:hypothetical protein